MGASTTTEAGPAEPPVVSPGWPLRDVAARARDAELAEAEARAVAASEAAVQARAESRAAERTAERQERELGELARLCVEAEDAREASAADLRQTRKAEANLRAQVARLESGTGGSAAELRQSRKAELNLRARVARLEEELRQSRSAAADLRGRLAEIEQTLAELLGSTSWRLTAPVRQALSLARGLRAPGADRREAPNERG